MLRSTLRSARGSAPGPWCGTAVALCCVMLLAAGCSAGAAAAVGPYTGQSVEVVGSWTGAEQANFERVLRAFGDRTGARVRYTSGGSDLSVLVSSRLGAGNPRTSR